MGGVRIRHVVNPLVAPTDSDLAVAQPVTFRAMRAAMDYAQGSATVQTVAAVFPEDDETVPTWFDGVHTLNRSILDVVSFEHRRKLPLLADLIGAALVDQPLPDLVVFSNIDIAPMPYFYSYLADAYRAGVDGLVINRRSVFPERADLPLSMLYAELGLSHPGRDCFVFTPDASRKFDLGSAIVGAGDIGRYLLWNVALHSSEFRWLRDHHLTFHIGDDRSWDRPEMAPYHDHNNDQGRAILARLEGRYGRLHDRYPWSELLPRPRGVWADRRWIGEGRNRLVRGRRRLVVKLRGVSRRRRPW